MTTDKQTNEVVEYLSIRGLLPVPQATSLPGGVSGETFLVECPPTRLVMKRALSQLLVAGDWPAKPERAMTEAAAIAFLHDMTPEHTPMLLDADPARHIVVMTAAPSEWVSWKSVLLGDLPDPTSGPVATAVALGDVLGIWHARTWHDPKVAAEFDDYEAFEQLRLAPFHRVVAAAHPPVAAAIGLCIEELEGARDCLVHGDFSPKNVLVGADGVMVLDFEVAHVGAAIFDLAFMSCHLALKAMHSPLRAALLADAGAAFLNAYLRRSPHLGGSELVGRLAVHTACLVLARVDGQSPATYLNSRTAGASRELALAILSAPTGTVDLWGAVGQGARRLLP